MKSFFAHSVALALSLAWFASPVAAQQYYQPSLLPIPAATQQQAYPAAPVAFGEDVPAAQASPSDAPSILPAPPMAQGDQSVLTGDFNKAAKGNWGDYNVVNEDGACGADCCNPCCCQNYWYGSVNALIMARSQHNDFLVARNAAGRVVCGCQFDMEFTGGIEATIGHTFNCGCNAIQFTYWGLYPETIDITGVASELGPLTSGINFTGATINGGALASDLTVDGTMQQYIVRQSFANFEAMVLGQSWGNGFIGGNMSTAGPGRYGAGYNGQRWGFGWMMGLRYFEFDNGATFNADGADEVFTGDANELSFSLDLRNQLLGFQLGGGVNWSIFNNFQVYGTAKAGYYNNNITQTMLLTSNGTVGQFGDGTDVNFTNEISRMAMIGQLDLGARFSITQNFTLNIGYRIMAASGIALTGNGIPADFTDSYYPANIEADGALILTGGYIGGEFFF